MAHVDDAEPGPSGADIRITATPVGARDPDWNHVPELAETFHALDRAQQALVEIDQRQQVDRQREAEETRAAQLARWHDDQRAADRLKQEPMLAA